MVQYGAAGTGLANGRSDVVAAPNVIHQTARCSFGAPKPRHPAQPPSSINLRQWHSPDYENNRFGKRKTLIGHPCGKDWCRESGTNTDGCARCRSPPPPLFFFFLFSSVKIHLRRGAVAHRKPRVASGENLCLRRCGPAHYIPEHR